MFSEAVLGCAGTSTSQIKDMFDWIFQSHTAIFDASKLQGFYQFAVLIGDWVDGNGGIQSKTGEGGADMWPHLLNVFQEIIKSNTGPNPVSIAAVTGNHDLKGSDYGAGIWSTDNLRRALEFLSWLYNQQKGPEHIPNTTLPFSSFKRWNAGKVPFLAVFIPYALPSNETTLVDNFLGNNANNLTIICSHISDETLSYTVAKHKQVFTSWWGHVPAAVFNNGTFDAIPVQVYSRPQFGNKCFIYRADWQEVHYDCSSTSNYPQHPLFCVFSFEVSPDDTSFTMTQYNVQAFNAANSTYHASVWDNAQALISKGPNISFNDKQTLLIKDYITLS